MKTFKTFSLIRLRLLEQTFIFLLLTHLFLIVCPAVFDQFELVSLASLQEIIGKMKPSSCSLDIIPSQILKRLLKLLDPKFYLF